MVHITAELYVYYYLVNNCHVSTVPNLNRFKFNRTVYDKCLTVN